VRRPALTVAGLVCLGLVGAVLADHATTQAQATPQEAQATPQKDAPKAAFDVSDCATCHENAVKGVSTTHHAAVEGSCASCHGDAAAHLQSTVEKGEPGPIQSIKKMKPADVNRTCQGCHEKTHNATFAGSAHERRGVACTSCHSVHDFKSQKAQLKTVREPDTCFTCHAAIRAQGLRTSHHPVREGLLTCTSCHNPHDGSRPKMINAEWTNELCYQCHAEKRGPFFWEHAPVRENCTLCHNPHGSNHDKLLVSQQPWLCQRCHLNTRHPGTIYTGINSAGASTSASNRAVEHACKNCHQNVHGGNAPTAPYLGR
jgi:DmsE family decaheme c-type cytochrome